MEAIAMYWLVYLIQSIAYVVTGAEFILLLESLFGVASPTTGVQRLTSCLSKALETIISHCKQRFFLAISDGFPSIIGLHCGVRM